ncbi:methyltransferase [Aliihoeflea aestuarii]|jgi:tRNA1(Val) A37 N6-methylase TrmN6|uniref:tRNA1(Val) (adenine(37)-N6)-methyltransferase n=1 Tax=Aliihoeflea aestuarii TaxID=453840 RepID=UPI00209568D0|nr:methyltransferase [Aliihoeflea aestuarii]MCO6392066.1 methyltransferase [Aliihoeflea aestuarii]
MSGLEDSGDHTIDAFHRGRFHLVQPSGRGHRAGLDAMILAASVPSGFAGRVADLGAGAGGAGLAVLARCDGASVRLVEREPEMAGFARRTLALPENAMLSTRADLLVADVTLRGNARHEAGLGDNSCGFAIMNPPFNEARDRASPDTLRVAAHVMNSTMFADWVRTAAAIVRPGGGLAIIARPASLAEILAAIDGRFGSAELIAIHPRPGKAAIRIVLRAWRGRRGALSILAPLHLHHAAGNGFTETADAIINGRATLFGD